MWHVAFGFWHLAVSFGIQLWHLVFGMWLWHLAMAFGCDKCDYGGIIGCGIVIGCGMLRQLWHYRRLWHFVDFAAAFAVLEDTFFIKDNFHLIDQSIG